MPLLSVRGPLLLLCESSWLNSGEKTFLENKNQARRNVLVCFVLCFIQTPSVIFIAEVQSVPLTYIECKNRAPVHMFGILYKRSYSKC